MKTKKLFYLILFIVLSAITSLHLVLRRDTYSIKYVESDLLLKNYSFYNNELTRIKSYEDSLNGIIDSLIKKWSVKFNDYKSKSGSSNLNSNDSVALHLIKMKEQIENFTRVSQEKVIDMRNRAINNVNMKITKIIMNYSKEHNIDIVLGANGDGNLIYIDSTLNITQDLIKFLHNSQE